MSMKERKRYGTFISVGGFLLCPALTFILIECYTHNPFGTLQPAMAVWVLNLVFYWMTALFFLLLIGQLRFALMAETVLAMVVGLANYYVLVFRSSPILPWDIYSFRTAASVADNFSYALPGKVWLVLIGFVFLLVAEWFLPGRIITWKRGWQRRFACLGICCLVISGFTTFLHQPAVVAGLKLYDKLFTPDAMQRRNGCAVAFLMELKYLIVEKPEGYEAETAAEILDSYGEDTGIDVVGGVDSPDGNAGGVNAADSLDAADNKPNIIVVMNEAFSDMGVIGELDTGRDYVPFLHELQQGADNTITGTLHVSVLGGNTANTEFEFLTGSSMAFFPEGSIPYQQYIRGELPSMASELKAQGYQTVAMHPYHASGWSRNQVYPWFGFDRMVFLNEFENPEYIRKYVSDKSDYDKIIEIYEQKDPEKPLFLFNVTMQNHGGYGQSFDNFTPDVTAEGIKSQPLSDYLSLISLSDSQFERLIDYFAEQDEDTMIVMFGDHQPNDSVANPIWRANGVDPDELSKEQEASRYEVPFVIWANFDIGESTDRELSVNYLAGEVLRQAGLPLSPYRSYLEALQLEYPVISARQILDNAGNTVGQDEKEELDKLREYQQIQYYMMFDRKQQGAK